MSTAVQDLGNECTPDISTSSANTANPTLIYVAAIRQRLRAARWNMPQVAVGWPELSSIKQSENKLHNITTKWPPKVYVCTAGNGKRQFVSRGGAALGQWQTHAHTHTHTLTHSFDYVLLFSREKRAKFQAVINHQLRLNPSGIMR